MDLYIYAVTLGIALAMDAFSVSIANCLKYPDMKQRDTIKMIGVFGFAQFLMPLIGWIFVHTLLSLFDFLVPIIPWVACIILVILGGKMIYEALQNAPVEFEEKTLFTQAIATSIDALSVGIVIGHYDFLQAFVTSIIIGVITCVICYIGASLGKKIGEKLGTKASMIGGIILIVIGIKILLEGVL